ncbi:uncharacterized protein LOC123009019 [Tribolium madens]|uniref:uncharacterized protein LOC123009019 n=1 Tax=Tribolium madens TaxID=41895 RepID=UPI001CF73E3D|nr:uncharacterized protein LOC123009019 [Tribolium madens]
MKKIQIFFNFGRVLAVTPSNLNNRKRTLGQKFYFFAIIVLYTGGAISSQIFRDYSKSTTSELAMRLFKDFLRHSHTFYILGPLALTKRHHWFKLFEILQKDDTLSGPDPIFFWCFLAWHCLFITIIVVWIRLCFLLLGLKLIQTHGYEYFQLYFQVFFMFFACVLLEMFRKRYEVKKIELGQITRFWSNKSHEKFKVDIFRLALGVGTFNKIFGPMFILNVFYVSDLFLLYVNSLIKSQKSIDVYIWLVVYRIGLITFYWLHVVVIAIRADSISQQYDEIIHLANKFFLISTKMDRKNVEDFIEFLRKNRPEINADEFFIIKRATIFTILNFTIYFLVVVIEFQ